MRHEFSDRAAFPNIKTALALFDSLCYADHKFDSETACAGITFFDSVTLPGIAIYRADGIGIMRGNRTRQHILADSSRDFLLAIPLDEQVSVTHAGERSTNDPGTFRFLSTSVPSATQACGLHSYDRFSGLRARISGSMLRQLVPDIDGYPNLVVEIRSGVGKIMLSLLETGLCEGKALSPSQARDFGKIVIQAIANALLNAPEIQRGQTGRVQSPYARIRAVALDFIDHNLSNPDLDCALVAERCHVSESQLHAAFAAASLKVGGYIRETRLRHCQADLQNPTLGALSITQIMTNWGFVDPTSFGQTYKARFGGTPRQDRNTAFRNEQG